MEISRRGMLGGAVALSGGAVLPRLGYSQPALGPEDRSLLPPLLDKHLKTPDLPEFSHIQQSQCCDHYRPHRRCGIRLEMERRDALGGRKFIIHNYGHSGAGVTLSWGCAGEVMKRAIEAAKQLPPRTEVTVAVLGAGVIGLTSAYEIRRAMPNAKITIYEKAFNVSGVDLTQSCSWIAGGQIEPSVVWQEYLDPTSRDCRVVKPALLSLMKNSMVRIRELANTPDRAAFGIEPRKNYTGITMSATGFEKVVPERNFWKRRHGILPFDNLDRPGQQIGGFEYETWLMNPRYLMPHLVRKLQVQDVKFEKRDFQSQSQVMALGQRIIVNCTGMGAAKLFNDTAMEPIKGKLIILPNPQKLDYFFSGGCGGSAYLFGRQDDIVIGGTYERPQPTDSLARCEPCQNRTVGTRPVPRGALRAECKEFYDRVRTIFFGDANRCTFHKDPPVA